MKNKKNLHLRKVFLLTIVALSFLAVKSQSFDLWLTSGKGSERLAYSTESFGPATGSSTITINENETYQTIDGFGYTLTEASAKVISEMSSSAKNSLLNDLYGTNGLDINIVRLGIGATDLGEYAYSYHDDKNGTFSLDGPDLTYTIPILQEILAIDPEIKILATPWSAPTWMKTNENLRGGELETEHYADYAQYWVNYMNAMRDLGIEIWAVTPQNEPENAHNTPSMVFTKETELDFVNNHLGPALRGANFNCKILAFDHNCDNTDFPSYVANNSSYVDGAAFHLYDAGANISALTTIYNTTGKNVYFTEQYTGAGGDFGSDLSWHIEKVMIGSINNYAKIALEWNLAADPDNGPYIPGTCESCQGAITVDGDNTTKNVSYYIAGQMSKVIKKNAVRIGTSSTNDNLVNTAVKNTDGSIALVVLNNGMSPITFNVSHNGSTFDYTLTGGDVVSFRWLSGDPINVEGVSITPTSIELMAGETYTLTETIIPANASNKSVIWSSSDNNIATVSPEGLVSAISEGTATITVSSNEAGYTASSSITVTEYVCPPNIPGKIEAEDYSAMEGIQTEPTTDIGGGENVGWADTGDWFQYNICVASDGNYKFSCRVASKTTGGQVKLFDQNSNELGSIDIPVTGEWQNWVTIESFVNLTSDITNLRFKVTQGGFNLNWFEASVYVEEDIKVTGVSLSESVLDLTIGETAIVEALVSPTNASNQLVEWSSSNSDVVSVDSLGTVTANTIGDATITITTEDGNFEATCNVTVQTVIDEPFTILIQAEEYFEMSGIQTENTEDIGGGLNVGWTDKGDWMGYEVEIPDNGTYTVEYRVASILNETQLTLEQFGGSTQYGTITIPNTFGWQKWRTISHTVTLSSGSQNLGISVTKGGWNLNWFKITEGAFKSTSSIEQGYPLPLIGLALFPNPASNIIQIVGLDVDVKIEVFSITGIKIAEKYGTFIDVSNLNKGLYILRTYHDGIINQKKFLKE